MAISRGGLIVGAASLAAALHGAAAGSGAEPPAAASGAFRGFARRAEGPRAGAAEGPGPCPECPCNAGGRRLERIAAVMAPSFAAAPKDRHGAVTLAGAQHLLRMYLGIERGWRIRIPGLEPDAWQANATRAPPVDASMQRLRAAAGALFDERADAPGFSLEDVASLAATLEGVVADEFQDFVAAARHLNRVKGPVPLALSQGQWVLTTAMLLFQNPGLSAVDFEEKKLVAPTIQKLAKSQLPIPNAWDTAKDALRNFRFAQRLRASPFSIAKFSAQELSTIGTHVVEDWGKIKNRDCRVMKDELMTRDKHGTGLVPLAIFYAPWGRSDSKASHSFEYTETVEHLRAIGALDETSASHPQVRLVNYMLGPANCGARTSTASLCCMSECAAVVSEIESQVQAPTATADRLLGVVGNVSTDTVDAPRRFPSGLAQRLHAIAAKRGGQVPLHGRLFAEWLHFAFPHECPFPHAVEDAAVHTRDFWMERQYVHNDTEQEEARARFAVPEEELHSGPTDHGARPWVEEEVLHMEAPSSWAGVALRGAAQAAVLVGMCSVLFRAAWVARPGADGGKVRGSRTVASPRSGACDPTRQGNSGGWAL